MARAERLLRLIDTMRRLPQPVTAARLAHETGVSERSLYRDIASLRASGALIDGASGLGYTL
ncbi:MAG: HTH domain-containing protein, partial [Rhodobacteraceae bacterium]|nr:HTH domain-containing protein [Paracoccaceae bacterium]